MERPPQTVRVTLECAGNGRSRLTPRPLSVPWLFEAIGTADWTGTSVWPILDSLGIKRDAREAKLLALVVETGAEAPLVELSTALRSSTLARLRA